jgi:hypothetical protein
MPLCFNQATGVRAFVAAGETGVLVLQGSPIPNPVVLSIQQTLLGACTRRNSFCELTVFKTPLKTRETKQARNKHQTVPVKLKIGQMKTKTLDLFDADGAINC